MKADLLYDLIDTSDGFYCGTVEKKSRSRMNAPLRISSPGGDQELEKKFVEEAAAQNMIQLKGHRSVGGIRVSMYNALKLDDVKALADFMRTFRQKYQKQ
ncbi:Phosphoserine aminotransferase [Porites harrisoni]